MKQQEQTTYDPTIIAPYTVFRQIDSNQFFVNSLCIFAIKKIITIGKEYIVVDNTKASGVEITKVKLVDCYYRKGILHLTVRDIRSQIVFTLDHNIEFPENDCTWLLIDIDYFKDRENLEAIQAYCECDIDSKNKNDIGISHKPKHEDNLLEFEF